MKQADQLVIGADLGGPVRGGFPASSLQAGLQPRLKRQLARVNHWPHGEPLIDPVCAAVRS